MKQRLLILIIMCFMLSHITCCGKVPMYKIDFSGQKGMYMTDLPKGHSQKLKGNKGKGGGNQDVLLGQPKDEYKAGEDVVLYFFMVATDTNYTFLLDGTPLNPKYSSGKGYVIRFTMPEHDVTLQCTSRNTMIIEEEEADTTE